MEQKWAALLGLVTAAAIVIPLWLLVLQAPVAQASQQSLVAVLFFAGAMLFLGGAYLRWAFGIRSSAPPGFRRRRRSLPPQP